MDLADSPIRIYYFSVWEKVLIHYTFEGPKNWKTEPLRKLENFKNIFYYDVPQDKKHIRFVFCDENQKNWDNPSPKIKPEFFTSDKQKGPRDYYIKMPGIFAVYKGDILKIKNHTINSGRERKEIEDPTEKEKKIVIMTDLDGTLVGDDDAHNDFNIFWIENGLFNENMKLIYSTGRSWQRFQELFEEKGPLLLWAETIICSNGGEIRDYTDNKEPFEEGFKTLGYKLDIKFRELLRNTWNSKEILPFFEKLPFFGTHEDKHDQFCLRFVTKVEHLDTAALQLVREECKKSTGFPVKTIICGSGSHRFIDVQPELGGKNLALNWIRKNLDSKNEKWQFYAFGDGSNDIDMLLEADFGTFVANYQPDVESYLRERKNDKINLSGKSFARAIIKEIEASLK